MGQTLRLAGSELYTQEPQRVAELQARYAHLSRELWVLDIAGGVPIGSELCSA